MLGASAGMCSTARTAVSSEAGNLLTSCLRASTPPAEAPITISRLFGAGTVEVLNRAKLYVPFAVRDGELLGKLPGPRNVPVRRASELATRVPQQPIGPIGKADHKAQFS